MLYTIELYRNTQREWKRTLRLILCEEEEMQGTRPRFEALEDYSGRAHSGSSSIMINIKCGVPRFHYTNHMYLNQPSPA